MKKKHYFIKTVLVLALIFGFFTYAYNFPRTMELLDEKINTVAAFSGKETDIKVFEGCHEFAEKTVNEILYYIEVIKYNIKENFPEKGELPSVIFTCLGNFPTESRNITSNYGERVNPILEKEEVHTGIDIAAALGSDITASWPGAVKETGFSKIYGNYVIVEHSKDFFTKYCHLSKISVAENEFITAGEKLGEAGSTGLSTGSHLHFEVIVEGIKIDPRECLLI